MRKRLLVLLMAAFMVVMSAAPALARPKQCTVVTHPEGFQYPDCPGYGHTVDDNEDPDQGGGNNHIKQNRGSGND
jgi:hypothetical protein